MYLKITNAHQNNTSSQNTASIHTAHTHAPNSIYLSIELCQLVSAAFPVGWSRSRCTPPLLSRLHRSFFFSNQSLRITWRKQNEKSQKRICSFFPIFFLLVLSNKWNGNSKVSLFIGVRRQNNNNTTNIDNQKHRHIWKIHVHVRNRRVHSNMPKILAIE